MQSFHKVARARQTGENKSLFCSGLVPSDGCKPVYLQLPADLLHFEASRGFSGLVSFILPLIPGRDSIWPYSV